MCAALPGTQRAPERDAALTIAPANSQPALSEREKLRDLTEGTVGLLYCEKAKLSVIKLPRHIIVQQTRFLVCSLHSQEKQGLGSGGLLQVDSALFWTPLPA